MIALTEHDRQLIDRSRDLGPALRASTGDRDRLAGWLLAGLADLAERLGGGNLDTTPQESCEDGHSCANPHCLHPDCGYENPGPTPRPWPDHVF